MKLPEPIQAYFDADQQGGSGAFLGAFASDATVKDEGRTYRGLDEIGAWWREAKQKYDHKAQPFDVSEQDGVMSVRATVTGKFPTSPAVLAYRFKLDGNRIAELEITA